MPLNQRKCPACGKWTPSNESTCAFCGQLLDYRELRKREIEAERTKRRDEAIARETPFERRLRLLEESDKLHHRILVRIGRAAFTVYMGIVSFFIWLIAFISG